ncbi:MULTISPECIES: CBS domain-containing protein [unclassified Streptomyces]|uniref:CBS domain-containing protein n=1 Tax=unclassified Streptomyces TaxID=2593676 RepID=UPI002DD94983|nr:CBS domain-containing protein [Streptomyces sp. NBC_01750]WSB04404.1 CBS domain-containing protein [Streptomyces sp. NBC_01794]WSD31314.1 CBS domain-containing protein [Streptomyces sp. NBC_01750]
MSEREKFSAGAEARRAMPGGAWSPEETRRQDMLVRYIGAVAAISTKQAVGARPAHEEPPVHDERPTEQPEPSPVVTSAAPTAPLRVREVMDVPAASVRGDLPFMEIARMLSREHFGSVPVVDAEDRVMGVVSESDLLAKAAIEASGHRPGAIGRLRERRLHEKAEGETAEALMTSPAVAVYPGASVAEAAWVMALSRLKRLPVTDHEGRLVGVVQRNALLQALVRDDSMIRQKIESEILERHFPKARDTVEVTVHNGAVEVSGRMDEGGIPRLLAQIKEIEDVTEVVDHLSAE